MAMVNAKKWQRFFDNFVDEYGRYPANVKEIYDYIRLMERGKHGTVHGTGETGAGAGGDA